jgi:hypothetical protein
MKTCFCHNLWQNFRKPINSSGKAKLFSLFLEIYINNQILIFFHVEVLVRSPEEADLQRHVSGSGGEAQQHHLLAWGLIAFLSLLLLLVILLRYCLTLQIFFYH